MNKEAYIGIDLGTSSIKAIAVDKLGFCIATTRRPLQIISNENGQAEQNPYTWKTLVGECLRDLVTKLSVKRYKPIAVAATGQMNGPVLLDKNDNPIGLVPLWNDTRCTLQCERIQSRVPKDKMLDISGHVAVTGYTAPKLMWIAENEPEVLRNASKLIFPKDYITKLLTGVIITDYSDASNSLLLDINRGIWDRGIIRELHLDSLSFPLIVNGTEIVGCVSKDGAVWSGLQEGTPVAAGVGDSIAAALGSGIYGPSKLQIVVGTAGNVNCVLSKIVIDQGGRVHTGFYVDNNHWICTGVLQSSGESLHWWSEVTGKFIDELIREVKLDKPTKVLFAPYLSGERTPHLDPHIRGAFVSLDRNTTRADMTKAIMEGVAFSLRDVIEVFYTMGIQPQRASITGGAVKSDILCQIITNAVNLPLERITADVTARGAAVLAGCAAGLFYKWQDAAKIWHLRYDLFSPDQVNIYQQVYVHFRELYPHMAELKFSEK